MFEEFIKLLARRFPDNLRGAWNALMGAHTDIPRLFFAMVHIHDAPEFFVELAGESATSEKEEAFVAFDFGPAKESAIRILRDRGLAGLADGLGGIE